MLVAAVVATTAVAALLRLVGCTAVQYAQVGTLMFRVPSPGVREPARLIELGPIVAQGTGPIAVMVMERIAELRGARPLSEPQRQALHITAEAAATMPTATGSVRATILTDCRIGSEFLHSRSPTSASWSQADASASAIGSARRPSIAPTAASLMVAYWDYHNIGRRRAMRKCIWCRRRAAPRRRSEQLVVDQRRHQVLTYIKASEAYVAS